MQMTKLLDHQTRELQTYIWRLLQQNERFLYTFEYVSEWHNNISIMLLATTTQHFPTCM